MSDTQQAGQHDANGNGHGHAQAEALKARLERITPDPYLLGRGFPPRSIQEAGWRVEALGERHQLYGLPADASEIPVWKIPYLHPNGRVWFERIRLIRDEDLEHYGGGKYRQPAGISLALYDPYLVLGYETFEPIDALVLIEGEANTVAVRTLLPDMPVLGLPGQRALTVKMAEQLAAIPCVYLWLDRHDPGATENAQRIAERLAEAGVSEIRQLPPAPADMDANDMLREDFEGSRQFVLDMLDAAEPVEPAGAEEWPLMPAPVPPAFPVEALGETIAAFVQALAVQTQTAPDMAALAVLGVLSAVGMNCKVDCGNWETETCSLYTLVVSPSGDRKSTVLKRVAAPLYRLEQEAREEGKARKALRDTEAEKLTARKAQLIRELAKLTDDDDRAERDQELEELAGALSLLDEEVDSRLLTDDATPEGMAKLMAKHENGIAVVSAESAVIDNLLGHYSDKGKANLHAVCKAFNAEYTSVDRGGAEPLIIPRPLLSITLLAQPHVLENVLGHGIARSQGLIGRFILADASAASYVGRRQIDPPPPKVPTLLIEAWDRVVQKVKSAIGATEPTQPPKEGSSGGFVGSVADSESRLLTLSLSPSSKKLLTELELSVEPRQADGADLATYRDWVSRHHGRIARIAALLHLAERSPQDPIAVDVMERALRIGEYVLAHGLLALSAPDESLRRALGWLARHEEPVVSRRDIHHGFLGGHGKADRAQALIDKLMESDALRLLVEKGEPGPKGGRPAGPRYEINPKLRAGQI